MLVEETRVDVTIGEADNATDTSALRKERPVWMVESTIVTNDQVSNRDRVVNVTIGEADSLIPTRFRKNDLCG